MANILILRVKGDFVLKRSLSVVLAVVLLLSTLSFVANATQTNEVLTPGDYGLRTIEREIENNLPVYYDENGDEVDITQYNRRLRTYFVLPESYDLRDENRSTPVRNQGSQGLCWDFAATASIESNILTNSELRSNLPENAHDILDLSEAGNSWYLYTNIDDENSVLYNSFMQSSGKGEGGGFADDVAMGFSSGYGVYPEELLPYEDWNKGYTESLRFYSDYRFRDFNTFSDDIELTKQRIIENGAVTVSYTSYSSNYNLVDGIQAYYDNGQSIEYNPDDMGHVVTVIGWDDNFSREYFHEEMRPKNDGAWLCKNSWGEESGCSVDGYEGCFWMSYETYIQYFSQFEVQGVDNFDNIYQNQVVSNIVIEGSTSVANVFTATSDEVLEQICFSNVGYSDFTVDVYKLNKGYSSPMDGESILSFESSVSMTGTHCIDCPKKVNLSAGDIFSVVITDENGLFVNCDYESDSAKRNLSYITDENGDWIDVCDVKYIGYAAIKAYTSNANGEVHKDKLTKSIEKAESFEYSEEVSQNLIDELSSQLEKAKAVLADDSATQNVVDNTTCLLNNSVEKISEYYFEINSLDDFMTFYNGSLNGEPVSANCVTLNTDLDLSSIEDFKPMYSKSFFSGVFDGNNHTISGLNINDSGNKTGLFYELSGATIKNITFSNCNVTGNGFVGLLAAESYNSSLINCNIIDSKIISINDGAGGFVSYAEESVFDGCSIQDSEVQGRFNAGVFMTYFVETTNCVSKDVTLISTSMVTDADNTMIVVMSEDTLVPIVRLIDDKCIIEEFMGNIKSLTVEDLSIDVVENNDSYEFSVEKGKEYYVQVEFEESEVVEFAYTPNIISREIELVGYYGDNSDVRFPDEIGSIPVTSISDEFEFYSVSPTSLTFEGGLKEINCKALNGFDSLETVVFEEGIEVIGSEVFTYCPMLKSISLPDSLTEIGFAAFGYCTALEKVDFNENLKTIDDNAFASCYKLKNIVFPSTLETIGVAAFSGCGATCVVFGENIQSVGYVSLGHTTRYGVHYESVTVPDFTVYGYVGTDAERYAEANDFRFVDISDGIPEIVDNGFDYNVFQKGDVDLDGEITIFDATLIQKWLVDKAELNQVQQYNAMVLIGVDEITIMGATQIQKYVAKLISDFYGGAAG